MGRLIIGATAIVTGLVAALGVVVRRRRNRPDDVLPLDPAPPLRSSARAAEVAGEPPSIEADFGQLDPPESAPASAAAARKPRAPRKAPAGKGSTTGRPRKAATSRTAGPAQAGEPVVRPKRPTRVQTSPAASDAAESIETTPGDEPNPADRS